VFTGSDPFSRRATRPNIYWNTKGTAGAAKELSEAELKAAAARQALVQAPQKLKASQQRMDPAELIKVRVGGGGVSACWGLSAGAGRGGGRGSCGEEAGTARLLQQHVA
jgi:hypothetical protein